MANDRLETCKLYQTKFIRHNDLDYVQDNDGYIQVYTDGACVQNGKPTAKAGIGIYFCEGHPLNVSKRITGVATNNRAEMLAVIEAIQIAKENQITKLGINSDSLYVIKIVTEWLAVWKSKQWKLSNGKPIKNETELRQLDDMLIKYNSMKRYWRHVEAHKGIRGNEEADKLAQKSIQ